MFKQALGTTIDEKVRRVSLLLIFLFAAFLSFSIAGTQISYSFALLLFLILLARKKIRFNHPIMFVTPLLVFFIVSILATIFSLSPADSLFNLRKFLLIPITLLLPGIIQTKKELKTVVIIFLATACFFAVFGVAKYLHSTMGKVIATQSTTMTWGAMSVFFVVAWAALFSVLRNFRHRVIAAAAIIPQLAALILSYVRGAYLGAFVGILIIGFFKQKKLVFAFFALILILILLFPGSVWQRMASIPDLNVGSTQVRINQWRESIGIFKDYPVLGVGWIDLHDVHIAHALPGADLNDQRFHIGHFHNNFIQILMVSGILGLLAFLWFFYAILRQEWQIYKITKTDLFLHAISLAAFAGTIGFLVNGLFDWTFGDEEVVMILWFVVGLGLSAQKIITTPENAAGTE